MNIIDLIIPLGITTITLLVVTVLLGIRTNIIKANLRMKIHRVFAIATLVLSVIHGLLVFLTR